MDQSQHLRRLGELRPLKEFVARRHELAERYDVLLAGWPVIAPWRNPEARLVAVGFGVADAAHVAFAEKSGAAFVSCDDRLLKKCARHVLGIWCGNPVAYCEKENLR